MQVPVLVLRGTEDRIVSEWADSLGVPVRLQPEGDLGTRLAAAFDEGLSM